VYSPRDKKKLRKTFRHKGEAESWAADIKRGVDLGTVRAPTKRTLAEAATAWLVGAEEGTIRNRSGNRYKPATLRGYRQALEDNLLPEVGGTRLNGLTTSDLQELVDHWQAAKQAPSTIRNSIKPLQAIYRRARSREGLAINPTHVLELPAPSPKEVEIVAPEVAAELLAAVPAGDRAIWATALYAGRSTPLPGLLRDYLMEHRMARGEPAGDSLVFGSDGVPFQAAVIYRRADRSWQGCSLGRLRLHQARHTYASFMIAAGVNAKALSSFMGHSSIKVTFDLYGHLMPGTEAEAAALLDRYLGHDLADAAQRIRVVSIRE
jgi:integrase